MKIYQLLNSENIGLSEGVQRRPAVPVSSGSVGAASDPVIERKIELLDHQIKQLETRFARAEKSSFKNAGFAHGTSLFITGHFYHSLVSKLG